MRTTDLGKRVQDLRQARGLTLQGVAGPAGVSKVYLWHVEHGRIREPSAEKLARIAAALGTPVATLLGEPTADVNGLEVEIVPSLAAFLDDHPEIPARDRAWLARVEHRSRRPPTAADYAYVYDAARRACRRS